MKLRALSHHDNDLDTRFGDCILFYGNGNLIVYDCGHSRHKDAVIDFLEKNSALTFVSIVISHNDSDHTNGVVDLLDWLAVHVKYTVRVYTHQYLKHVDTILDKIDDGRRNRESLKQSLLAEFDNIKTIIETAQKYGFTAIEALNGTSVSDAVIVGPTIDEFTDVAAKAVDSRVNNNIGVGHAEETVMNAASVQLSCKLDSDTVSLLCGDASPDYLHGLDKYDIIQLPHHGQLANAEVVFDKLSNAGSKVFLISDNTGSSVTSGGSDDLMKSDVKRGKRIKNTKSGIIELPENSRYNGGESKTPAGIIITPNQKTGGYGA